MGPFNGIRTSDSPLQASTGTTSTANTITTTKRYRMGVAALIRNSSFVGEWWDRHRNYTKINKMYQFI
jgi:hypothetical protein